MTRRLTESHLEEATIGWFDTLGYTVLYGPDIASGESHAERASYQESILPARLKRTLHRLNPGVPNDALDEAYRKMMLIESPSFAQNNRRFHQLLVTGVPIEYQNNEGRIVHDYARLVDFEHPDENDWVVVNQFTVIEGQNNRRPDIVVFLNGLPIAVIELKNPADENATIWAAFDQLQTYKNQIPQLFLSNEVLIISDGLQARIGSLTANSEWFLPWRTISGDRLALSTELELEVLVRGVFERQRFLQYLRHFIVFEEQAEGTIAKKIAGYHQFHAVNRAVESTLRACGIQRESEVEVQQFGIPARSASVAEPSHDEAFGDKRAGVIWHTQGSGKSLTMAFFAGRIILHPSMENPTVVVITDRNDLDDQLYGTFSRCHELLRQKPVQAKDRSHLRQLLQVASGGVVFTTIQKFFPETKGDSHPMLSERRNIVVIADEAHRSQYDFIDGFARHMRDALPNASFIGFTGTPIELEDRNTRNVFGDYISIYDIQQAVEDKATVPIYYESRLAKIELDEKERPHIDPGFEEITEGEEIDRKEELKTKWAALEAVVGTEKRVNLIARDILDHYENRLTTIEGKAMIVCMSRRICIDLYNALTHLRPAWHTDDDTTGNIKIVMTGSASDPLDWQPHIRNKPRREAIANRFRDSADPLKIVIVRDMWLTGFDVPCLHTMYIDKPMRGHTLMQAIARVNRVFRDKPGGLVVDYIGLGEDLKQALATYTESGGRGKTAVDIEEAVAVMHEKYEICCGMFHGFDWSSWEDPAQRLGLLPSAQGHILAKKDGKTRFVKAASALSKAFALAVPHIDAITIRDDVAFFQAVRAALTKFDSGEGRKKPWELEHAIRQIVSNAITTDQVIDIFSAAGLKKPDISILSEEFLAEVRGMPQRNLAVELLRKLLNDEIRTRSKRRLVQSRSFAEMLDNTIHRYQHRAIETVEVIEELIKLARELREADQRGEELGLTEAERAFYDALEVNDSAVKILGDEILRRIAVELVLTIKQNVTIDWTVKESARANMRVMVKRILRKYKYPDDKQQKAVDTVLKQAELLCGELAAA